MVDCCERLPLIYLSLSFSGFPSTPERNVLISFRFWPWPLPLPPPPPFGSVHGANTTPRSGPVGRQARSTETDRVWCRLLFDVGQLAGVQLHTTVRPPARPVTLGRAPPIVGARSAPGPRRPPIGLLCLAAGDVRSALGAGEGAGRSRGRRACVSV